MATKKGVTGTRSAVFKSAIVPLKKKRGGANRKISDDQKKQLELLFFQDGITPATAAKLVNVDYDTAVRYFDQFAENLIRDGEYESWAYRQKRVRARSLEGTTQKIIFVTEQRARLEMQLSQLTHVKAPKSEGGHMIAIHADELDKNMVLRYNRQITEMTQQLMELQHTYDAIDSKPPSDVIMKHEIQQMVNDYEGQQHST